MHLDAPFALPESLPLDQDRHGVIGVMQKLTKGDQEPHQKGPLSLTGGGEEGQMHLVSGPG